MALGEDDAAVRTLEALEDSSSPESRRLVATASWNGGRYEEALARGSEAVREHPGDPAARQLLAWMLTRRGRSREAIEHARAAVESLPNDPRCLATLAAVASSAGDRALARETTARLTEVAPDSLQSHELAGHVALQDRRWDEAERAYRRALNIDAHSHEARLGLGMCLQGQGKSSAAVGQFVADMRDHPGDPLALLRLHELVESRAQATSIVVIGLTGLSVVSGILTRWDPEAGVVAIVAFLAALATYGLHRVRMRGLPVEATRFYRRVRISPWEVVARLAFGISLTIVLSAVEAIILWWEGVPAELAGSLDRGRLLRLTINVAGGLALWLFLIRRQLRRRAANLPSERLLEI